MSQKEMILEYIADMGHITAWEAMRDLGIMRLASRVHEIRKSGIDITGTMFRSKNRYGKKIRYMIYTMEKAS